MTTCSVLRCDTTASTSFNPHPEYPPAAMPVCAKHGEAIEAGERWILDGQVGDMMDVSGEMPGSSLFLRMGSDLPRIITSMSMRRAESSEKGSLLTIHYESAAGHGSEELWVSQFNEQFLGSTYGSMPEAPRG